jgi:AraC-like DNA-binding protein
MSGIGATLLIFSMIHAYVFSLLLIFTRHTAKFLLALYMLNIAIEYFLLLNYKVFHINELNYLFYVFTPFITLVGLPSIYLYVKHLTVESFQLNWKTIIHALPSVLVLVFSIYFVSILPPEVKAELFKGIKPEGPEIIYVLLIYVVSILLMVLQVVGYSIHMFILLYRHDKNLENIYSSKDEVSLKWLKIFVVLFVLYCLYEVVVLFVNGVPVNETFYYSIISLHVFVVGIFGIRQRDIYKKNLVIKIDQNEDESEIISQQISEKKQLSISQDVIQETLTKLTVLMQKEKIYRDEDLSLYDLSSELNINRNYLSHIINENFNSNFYNYVNSYRIEEAKTMLLDPEFDNLSIEGIAKSVGFKSRNVFYPVFKKFVGQTPAEFKLNNRNTIGQ